MDCGPTATPATRQPLAPGDGSPAARLVLHQHHAIAPARLGQIERVVGALHEALHTLHVGRTQAHPDAGGEKKARAAGLHRLRLHRDPQALGDDARCGQVGVGAEHQEFVAAGPAHEILRAHGQPQGLGRVAQGDVADV